MAIQTIPVGTVANDGTGIAQRDGWIIVNANFAEMVTAQATFSANAVFKNADADLGAHRLSNVRPPSRTITASVTLGAADKGGIVYVNSINPVNVTLPNDWEEAQAVILRRKGAGDVSWVLAAGATIELPTSRATHSRISEQYEEIVCRVVANANGASAVWYIGGATI